MFFPQFQDLLTNLCRTSLSTLKVSLSLLKSSRRFVHKPVIQGKNKADMESIIMNLKRKEKKSQSRRLGKYLKEQKGRIYIIRRCVMMLLCSRD
ncbi:hypothetical protein Bca4012_003561 [Brassica carinata]